MTEEEARKEVVGYWLNKAEQAIASAKAERAAGRHDFAVNRTYYACFYAASAVLLREGKTFVKHSGVRGAVHRDLVKSGLLDSKWGKAYDRLFENRQLADYVELTEFTDDEVAQAIDYAMGFLTEISKLLDDKPEELKS